MRATGVVRVNCILRIINAVRGTLRYKLLVLVLFPILLITPIALLLAIYWGNNFTYQQLFIKVNTDLSVSHDVFRRIREDYLNSLSRLSDSYAFRIALDSGDNRRVQEELAQWREQAGFDYLYLVDPRGHQRDDPDKVARLSPLLRAALEGNAGVGVEVFTQEQMQQVSLRLANQVLLPLIVTPRARPTPRQQEDRAMVIRALFPIKDASGKLLAVMDGGVLLNGNFSFVDTIRDLVYGAGSLLEGSIGTVTVFLDDVRITTNVPLRPGERALGTRVSNEVRNRVLDQGEVWIDRAFVVNDWYISSYEPILDTAGERIGMLYAGFLEAPFRSALYKGLAVLGLLFLVLMVFSALLAVQGAKSIFKPLERISEVAHATRAGENRRIGRVMSQDEIGELAREFDAMLDRLKERNQEIQHWADQLEDKVEERTSELQRRNEELQHTIRVLHETRQQLVVAEKLAALGELTAGVAHEINNPTAVILGNIDVMMEELGDHADPIREDVQLIIEQIYRIKEIINNLLQYSRPEQFVGYLTEVNVNQVVQRTLSLVRHLQKKEQFRIELQLEATRRIQLNPQELQQVLVNLVVNAVHAFDKVDGGKKNGVVRISTENWDEQGVVVHVEDNGVGIDESQLSRIFNPFFSTKKQGRGTGLGLSVSYGIIRRYGGNITVESQLGKGSRFSIWLLTVPELIDDETMLSEQLQSYEEEAALPFS